MTAPAGGRDNSLEFGLSVVVIAGAAGWFGYRWLTAHTDVVDGSFPLPGPLLITVAAAAAVAALSAAVLWRGLQPATADERRPEQWALRFRPIAALLAVGAAVLAATAAALGWGVGVPLLPALGLASAAALTASAACWDRFARAGKRTTLRSTLIQALYTPLGYRLPEPDVVSSIDWQPRTTTPRTVTVRAQRSAARTLPPADDDEELPDPDATPQRGDTAGVIRSALRTHAGVATRVRCEPSGLVYTATLHEMPAGDETQTDLGRKVKSVFGTGASVRAGSVIKDGDTITRFVVNYGVGHKLTGEFRKRLCEQNLTELLGGAWRTDWDMTAGTVSFELKPVLPPIVYPTPVPEVASLDQAIGEYRQTRLDFGVDLDMNVQTWNPLVDPHTLVGGKTGAGKTVFLRALVKQASRRGWASVIVDFKGGSFSDLVDWPNVHIVSSDPYDSIATIHRMYALMEHRNAAGRWDQKVWEHNVPFLIIIDEFTQLTEVIRRVWNAMKPKGAPKDPPTITELGELARLCRTARMHLVVGMQRPDADFLNTEVRDNFGNKVSVGPISRIAADMIFENSYTGRYVPRIKGRGMATGTHSEPRETQFYFAPPADTTNPEEAKIVAAMRPSQRLIPRYVPELPADPAAATWSEIIDARWFPLEQRPDLDPSKVSRQLTRFRGDSRLGFDTGAIAAADAPSPIATSTAVPSAQPAVADPTPARPGFIDLDIDPDPDEAREFVTVAAGEICEGDIVTFDGSPGYVDEIEIGPDGTVTVIWENDEGDLAETQLPAHGSHKVLRAA